MAKRCIKNSPPHDEWCHTHLKTHLPFSYKWTIKKFSDCKRNPGEPLKSSVFSAGSNEQQVELQLSIYPRGQKGGDENYLSLFLNIVSAACPTVRTFCKVTILNAEQNHITKSIFRSVIDTGSGFGWPEFFNTTALMKRLAGDNLIVVCKGSIILKDTVNTCGISNTVHFVIPECAVLDDLGQLLESCKFTDITISACGEEIQAHKAILIARSTVFSTILNSEKNRVEIADVEMKVLREMIRFIYTGKAPNLEKMADTLIVAADKYDLSRLKVMCAEALFKSLSSDNAADTLMLADQVKEKQLEVRTINFIYSNLKDVMNNPSFKIMAASCPHLTAKILRRITAIQEDSECESDGVTEENSEAE